MTDNPKIESDLELLPMLMTNDWFLPSDTKRCEVRVPPGMMPEDNPHLGKEQLQKLYSDKSDRIRNEVIKKLQIDERKVIIQSPHLTESTSGFRLKSHFEILINGKDEELPDHVELYWHTSQDVAYLKKIADAKATQIPVFQLKIDDLDSRGDMEFPSVAGQNLMRGGLVYKQPSNEWIRVGLRVIDKYENNQWLSMDGSPGEWAVGYHGSRDETGNIGIAKTREIRPGEKGQKFRGVTDNNELSDNRGNHCGFGSYFADDINISAAPCYAAEIKGRICVFQARLCPSKVRIPITERTYRIVNEAKYARPYGICVKMTQSTK